MFSCVKLSCLAYSPDICYAEIHREMGQFDAGQGCCAIFLYKTVHPKGLLTRREGSLASRLTLAGGQKTSRVYKQNFTGRVTLQLRTT